MIRYFSQHLFRNQCLPAIHFYLQRHMIPKLRITEIITFACKQKGREDPGRIALSARRFNLHYSK